MEYIKLVLLAGLITEMEIAAFLQLKRSKRETLPVVGLLGSIGIYYLGLLLHLSFGFQKWAWLQLIAKDFHLLILSFTARILLPPVLARRILSGTWIMMFFLFVLTSLIGYYKLVRNIDLVASLQSGTVLHITLVVSCILILYLSWSTGVLKDALQRPAKDPFTLLLIFFLSLRLMYSLFHLIKLSGDQAPRFLFPSYSPTEMFLLFLGCNLFIVASFRFSNERVREKYQSSRMDDVDKNRLQDALNQVMNAGKPYLDPNMTVEKLSQLIQYPPRHISQVINEILGMNFNEYLNNYRIEESKRLLLGDDIETKTLEWVSHQSGFGSKSAFFKAFKTATGITPSEYRKNILQTRH